MNYDFSGQSVLITGGTGTFGRACARKLLDSGVQRLAIISRGEHAQADMAAGFQGEDVGRLRFFIGDVRDRERLRRAFEGVNIVLHAAALKRIEVGAYNPTEMVKTNVLGAMNVVEAAHDAGVSRVVALSTDKAVEPISPYGISKAMAEHIFLAANNTRGITGPRYAVCRYGNIWGSNGSVVPKWKAMIAGGSQSVPVTDLGCSRFFMTIDQAVDLVLNTAQTMNGGELAIPDLPAYSLGDLVIAMGANAEVTGLPDWEKKHEKMDFSSSSDKVRRMSIDELRDAL